MRNLALIEESSEKTVESDRRGKGSQRLRRFFSVLAIGVLVVAVGAPLGLWLHYRQENVVSRNAWVRGHITYVGAPVDGVVAEVLVDDGDRVEPGEVMARFWDLELQARLESAQARLEQAGRELAVERLAIAQERRELQSAVARARAQREAAKARADDAKERHEVLSSLRDVATSREVIREAEADRRTTGAEWAAAIAAHHSVEVEYEGLSVREEGIAVFESRVKTARALVAERKATLDNTIIRAPERGRVVRRLVEPGTSLEVGDPVVSVWIGDRLWVEAWVDEKDLANVRIGNRASIRVKPFPDRIFQGVVEAVGVAPDFAVPESDVPQPYHARMRNTPVFLVRIAIEDPGDDLVPGLSAAVGICISDPVTAQAGPATGLPGEAR
jgi:multidrug resistance efflux pump